MIIAPLLANVVGALLGWTLFFVSVFLILLILVQRGRGGGLTGALGGPGGQSAFGTKAGDLFTKITSFTALGWIALCAFTMWLLGSTGSSVAVNPVVSPSPAETSAPAGTGTGSSGIVDLGQPKDSAPAAQPSGEAQLTPAQPAVGAVAPADAKPAAADAKPATEESPKPAAEAAPPANEPPAEPKAESAPAQPPAATETPAAPAAADAPKSE